MPRPLQVGAPELLPQLVDPRVPPPGGQGADDQVGAARCAAAPDPPAGARSWAVPRGVGTIPRGTRGRRRQCRRWAHRVCVRAARSGRL